MKIKIMMTNTVLIGCSVLIALLVCEVVIRVFSMAPEVVYIEKWRVRLASNPKIAYEPIPNLDSTGKEVRYYQYDGMSNGMGYRDYDHSIEKPEGQKRIVIIGDSVAQGLWINDDTKIYSVVLEKTLQSMGHNVEVLNFGVSGYNTQQEVETLIDKGLQFDPDLVILGYCLNDKFQDDGGIYGTLLAEQAKSKDLGKHTAPKKLNPLVKHSDFLRFLKFVVFRSESKEQPKNDAGKIVAELYNENNVEKYFGVLGELSKEHGFDTQVFIFPDFGKRDEHLLAGWENYEYAEEHRSIQVLAENNGLGVYDLYNLFTDCHNELGRDVSYDRYHPNPSGSECAGTKMAQYLHESWLK